MRILVEPPIELRPKVEHLTPTSYTMAFSRIEEKRFVSSFFFFWLKTIFATTLKTLTHVFCFRPARVRFHCVLQPGSGIYFDGLHKRRVSERRHLRQVLLRILCRCSKVGRNVLVVRGSRCDRHHCDACPSVVRANDPN